MKLSSNRWLVVLSALALLAGCVVNPVTGEREIALVSTSQEIAIGQDRAGRAEVRSRWRSCPGGRTGNSRPTRESRR